ncbi:oxysterol-binding protein homolog 7 [[Candida] railenensis]|uniref:Oxysterol-binding protein homolog 7 n=1 Tax=[Candida] railenensis TaxID=45579 RepID=A0A9P0VX70_9ASCO|nr:oxysterol-binding protein homolog 7 [[Candida] railenensis]
MGLTSKLDKLKLKPSAETDKGRTTTPPVEVEEDTSDIDEVDDGGKSILSGIIAQLRPGCDLTKITLPTFILEKKSMLERITNAFQTPDILLKANETDDELARFLLMVKWYLSCWHIAPKAVKKPLNPILGEVFTCYWDNIANDKTAYYISEQTSHHPPKSSYFYLIPESKIRVDGIIIPRSKFLGTSSAAIMEGWAHVTLGERDDEVYIVNQPNVYCRGILFGKLKYELGDHMYVKCPKTGYVADIEFKTKGFISGTYDAIEGTVKHVDSPDVLYTISGKWNDVMEIKDQKSGKKEVFYDTTKAHAIKPKVRPMSEQLDNESRKLWNPTVEGLKRRDHDLATSEKYKVENEQRLVAKKRLEENEEFHPKLFKINDEQKSSDGDSVEFIIDKDIDLSSNAEDLRKEVLSIAAILPGQNPSS